MKMLDAIAAATVTVEMLERATDAAEREHDLPDPAPVEFVLLRELNDDKLEPMVFAAIMFRMTALARLITEKDVDNWVVQLDGRKHVLIHGALLEAAAKARLVERGKDFTFDPAEFLELALAAVDAEGRA